MAIVWRDEISVGNEEIDNQHKYLIDLINIIESAVNCDLFEDALSIYIDQLVSYTKVHFRQEIEIQKEISFPFIEHHQKAHQNLANQLEEIVSEFKKIGTSKTLKIDPSKSKTEGFKKPVDHLFLLLRDWIIHHILEEDMKMKDYFKEKDAK